MMSLLFFLIFFVAAITNAFVIFPQKKNLVVENNVVSGRIPSRSRARRGGGGIGTFRTVDSSLTTTATTKHHNSNEEIYYEPLEDLEEELHPKHHRHKKHHRHRNKDQQQNDKDGDEDNLDDDDNNRDGNPMWPIGVSLEDVEILIDDILADKTMNIRQLPDFIERQIYKTTILLTLNTFYRLVGWIHGKRLWGHKFLLTRNSSSSPSTAEDNNNNTNNPSSSTTMTERQGRPLKTILLYHMKTDVDEELLECVADQLLQNQAINQPLIPDVLEKQLYVNCLKIIFRLLNMLAASFRITVCGHDLTLNLEKSILRRLNSDNNDDESSSSSLKQVAEMAVSSPTPIDTDLLRELARAKIYSDNDDEEDENTSATTTATEREEKGDDAEASSESSSSRNIWKRGQDEFIIQVNTVLYSLILGILDDLLANTELELMTDRIKVDIVAPSESESVSSIISSSTSNRKRRRKQRKRRQNLKKRRRFFSRSIKPTTTSKLQQQRRRRRLPVTMIMVSLASFALGSLFGIATGKRLLF